MKSMLSHSTLMMMFAASSLCVFAQPNSDQSIKNNITMETATMTNKEVIRSLYETVLNKRKFEAINDLVSEDYTNAQGERGTKAFMKGVNFVVGAFPDAQWTLESIVAEGNTVMVKQKMKGTQTNQFQKIPATGFQVSVDGFAIYELSEGKIIKSQVYTDRFGLLQQLNLLPEELR